LDLKLSSSESIIKYFPNSFIFLSKFYLDVLNFPISSFSFLEIEKGISSEMNSKIENFTSAGLNQILNFNIAKSLFCSSTYRFSIPAIYNNCLKATKSLEFTFCQHTHYCKSHFYSSTWIWESIHGHLFYRCSLSNEFNISTNKPTCFSRPLKQSDGFCQSCNSRDAPYY
jgi:hypothetical protein